MLRLPWAYALGRLPIEFFDFIQMSRHCCGGGIGVPREYGVVNATVRDFRRTLGAGHLHGRGSLFAQPFTKRGMERRQDGIA